MSDPRKSVLITGCSSGIGLDAAHNLQERGWLVFATCRKPEDCARLESEGLTSFPLDHADSVSIAEAVARAHAQSGGALDALVVNGAYGLVSAAEDAPRDAMREIFEANLLGPLELIQAVLPGMRARNSGRIVNVSSVLGFVSLRFRGPYCATKHALEAMSDALRLELKADGSDIRVSLLQPGPIGTKFRVNAIPPFERWINWKESALRETYETEVIPRLYTEPDKPDRFELGPEACTRKIIHALESSNPHPRYRVTTATYLAETLRRVATTRMRDLVFYRQ